MEEMTPTADLVQIDLTPRKPAPKPAWLKAKAPMGETFHNLKKMARELKLHTVCESAQCPNIGECWNQKAATFMMLGNLCTRRCGFCAVPKGKPEPIDFDEPRRVAYAVAQLGLHHAVITSVNRDDDNVGAARAFVKVIEEIRLQAPGCRVEILTPDFQGVEESLRLVVAARPEILNHNIETVPRLYRVAKSGGRYERSLEFLRHAEGDCGGDVLGPRRRPDCHQDRHHRRDGRGDARAAGGLPRPGRSQGGHSDDRAVSAAFAGSSADDAVLHAG